MFFGRKKIKKFHRSSQGKKFWEISKIFELVMLDIDA